MAGRAGATHTLWLIDRVLRTTNRRRRSVEALLERGADGDLDEAQAAIDRLAAVPTDPGFVLHELPLLRLRALVARARGDDGSDRGFMQRYRAMAATAGFAPLVDAVDPASGSRRWENQQ
jgi:hypothetical protein